MRLGDGPKGMERWGETGVSRGFGGSFGMPGHGARLSPEPLRLSRFEAGARAATVEVGQAY